MKVYDCDNEDHFKILRGIQKKHNSTQRELAEELRFSLGKLNYCLKALQKKGLVKSVFDTVYNKYDLMNDFMSFGIQRYWKRELIRQIKEYSIQIRNRRI